MKIKETAKGNVQITMSKEQASAILSLLDSMTMDDYIDATSDDDAAGHVSSIWCVLQDHRHLL